MKKNLTLLLFIFTACFAFAQTKTVTDSLINLLKTAKDTSRVNVYNQLSFEYRNADMKKTQEYAQLAINEATRLSYFKGLGNGYLNRGNYLKNLGNYEEALASYRWALIQHQQAGNKTGIASVLNSMANVYYLDGHFSKSLFYYLQSLKLSEELHDKRGEARTLNNIGVINLEQRNYSKALTYYEKAYNILTEIGDENGVADCLNNMGNIYHSQGMTDEAVKHYKNALEINKKLGDIKDESAALNNIGLVFYESGDSKHALDYYHQSLALDEKLEDRHAITISSGNIANCYITLEMFHAAKKYADRSLELAKTSNYRIDIVSAYEMLYKIADGLGNYKEALEHYKMYNLYSDSLFNEETRNKIAAMEQEYELKKEQEAKQMHQMISSVEEERSNVKDREIKKYVLITGLVLGLFVAVVYVVFFVIRKNS